MNARCMRGRGGTRNLRCACPGGRARLLALAQCPGRARRSGPLRLLAHALSYPVVSSTPWV